MKNKIINLEKEIEKKQQTIKEFTQTDINDLTVEGMQQIAETMETLKMNTSELFKLLKLTTKATQQNKERIEKLERKL